MFPFFSKRKIYVISSISLLILFGVLVYLNTLDEKNNTNNRRAPENEDKAITKEAVKTDEPSKVYIDYSKDSLADIHSSNKTPVLFFWASWCPTCRALEKELEANPGEVPKDVVILKVNYDTQDELKEKYNVVQQHTLIVLDKNNQEIKKWVGGGLNKVKKEINSL